MLECCSPAEKGTKGHWTASVTTITSGQWVCTLQAGLHHLHTLTTSSYFQRKLWGYNLKWWLKLLSCPPNAAGIKVKFVASFSTYFFFPAHWQSHRNFSLDEGGLHSRHVSTHHSYSCRSEPKARSICLASMTVKTWHWPHCHLVKTKKLKEVFSLSFHAWEKGHTSQFLLPACILSVL